MRCWGLLLLLLCGCSTAPVADMLDFFKPGKLEADKQPPYGGVCLPRQVAPPAGVAAPLPPPVFPTDTAPAPPVSGVPVPPSGV